MSQARLLLMLLIVCICGALLILADGNASYNLNGFPHLLGQNGMNGQNGMGINGQQPFEEEKVIAECTRCGDARLIGCMRGKCYYRCYRRCTLGNLTYQEAIRFTLPGY